MLVPGLKGNRLMAAGINRKITEMAGVRQAQANPLTGRVLVVFHEAQVKPDNLIKSINGINNGLAFESQLPRKNSQASALTLEKLQEPEDLPVREQLLNVAMGGGILAYLSFKRVMFGRSPLTGNPGIFNLAAVTAIVSGYPVLRSGFHSLARGRINHDLLMSIIVLSTVFLQESIPGLLVIWLVNLTALGQSLVLRSYRNALPELPETTGKLAQKQDQSTNPDWSEAGQEYGRRAVLPVFGLALLSGFAGGAAGFQRSLAMLLAADPSPAGLAAPTAATAAMAGAGKKGILYRDEQTLEVLSAVDTVIFTCAEALPEASYQVADIIPAPGITKKELIGLAAEASCQRDNYHCRILRKALAARVHRLRSIGEIRPVLADEEQNLTAGGIDTRWGFFKARRLQHLGQFPVFVAMHGRLAGLIGIRQHHAADLRELVNDLRAQGISNIGLTVEKDSSVLRQSAYELGIHHVWPGLTTQDRVELIGKLKRRGKKIAVVMGDTSDPLLLQEADVSICLAANLKDNPVDVVILSHTLLPEAFHMAIIAKQQAKQNLALVRAANTAGLALGATGLLPPVTATVYNNLISVVLGANSLRLMSGKPSSGKKPPPFTADSAAGNSRALALADNHPETCQQVHLS